MLSLGNKIQYYLYSQPTDMRKGVDGLCGLINNHLKKDPLQGDAFIFIGKNRRLIKILFWDRTGFVVYYKRLEQGCFELPKQTNEEKSIEIDRRKLMMILEGISLKKTSFRKRFNG